MVILYHPAHDLAPSTLKTILLSVIYHCDTFRGEHVVRIGVRLIVPFDNRVGGISHRGLGVERKSEIRDLGDEEKEGSLVALDWALKGDPMVASSAQLGRRGW
jgi:hypothetical protein